MSSETLDLIAELEALSAIAAEGLRKLSHGEAVNGRCSLVKLKHRADDAVRHAQQEVER